MEKNEHIERLVSKLLAGNISPDELQELNAWYDSLGEDLTGRIPDKVTNNKEEIKTRMFRKLQEEVRQDKSERRTLVKSAWKLGKVAAVLAIVIAGSYIAISNGEKINNLLNPVTYTAHNTQEGKRSNFLLPDGSKVWLNANSELKYTNRFNGELREVYLKGEAFFDVKRDETRPFSIQTEDITTTVLGTSFNIKAVGGEDIEVTVATGKVRVTSSATAEEQSILLSPYQQAAFNSATQSFTQKEVDLDIYLTWKEDKLIFNEINLSKAIAMLENRYEVDIILKNEDMANCTIIGEHENESLENVLKAMQFVLGFDYSFKSPGVVEIAGNGCN